MIRNIATGAWVCTLALGACYMAASYAVGSQSKDEQPQHQLIGVQYKKLPAVNVPIIADGAVKGYIVAQMVFTADADTLRTLSVPADAFIRDEAFRYMYSDTRIDFANLSRYNVNQMIADVRSNVNKRLGAAVVKEILLEGINFVDKADIRP